MDLVVKCPKDGRLLGEIGPKGEFLGTCAKCKLTYGASLGTLISRHSRQETIQRQTSKQRGVYQRNYELRLNQPGGRLLTIAFTIPGKADTITVRKNDQVVVLYQADSKGDLQSVLRVQNKATGDDQYVGTPKAARGVEYLVLTSIIISIAAWIVLISAGFPEGVAFVMCLIPGVAFGFYTIKVLIKRQRVELPPEKLKQADEVHSLLGEKARIRDRLRELTAELSTAQSQFARTKSLYLRMSKADATAYASRMQTLKAAGSLLKQSVEGSTKLIAEYGKALEIIDIEYESGQIGQDFASNPDSLVSQKLEELKVIEAHNLEVQALLEANEEVRKLGAQ
jgi:hypothetical protein